ncbi:hypothetical protein MYU51_006433 [Penicillium brevicompactum]
MPYPENWKFEVNKDLQGSIDLMFGLRIQYGNSSCLRSDDKYFRVPHHNDRVPQIPPTQLGFKHHGPEYWEKGADQNDASTTLACGTDSGKCNAAQSFGGDSINRSHLTYTNLVIGNSLFIEACGASGGTAM